MKRWISAFVAMAAFAVAGQAWAQNTIRSASPSVNLSNAAVYVAEELGYFKQMNVALQTTLSAGPSSVAAAISGDLDAAFGSASTFINARRAGGDIVMFTALNTQFGVNIVVTRKWADQHKVTASSSHKDKVAALKGATIGITSLGGSNDQLVRYLAEDAGLNADRDMTLVIIAETSAMVAAFGQNRVDALSVSSPTSPAAAREANGEMLFNLTRGEFEPLNGYFGAAIAARSGWLRQNADLAARFAGAVQIAFDAMHDPARSGQARDAVQKAKFPQMDPALFAVLWDDQVKGSPKGPDISRQMVQRVIDFNNRFAKDKLDPALIDGAFTNEAVERGRQAIRR